MSKRISEQSVISRTKGSELHGNMRVYIASDFHLKFSENEEDSARRKRVLSFLESLVGKADLLILNGDIFDIWFVWKTVIIKGYFPILKKLADLRENGCRIVFIAGNHDFWFKDFLEEELGFEIFQDKFSEIIDDKNVFVSHGDLFTSNDFRYKLFRKLVRNKIIMKIFEIIHPDIALNLGKFLSRSSRDTKIPKAIQRRKESGLDKFAKQKLKNYDIVILGHSHLPKYVEYENGIYLNSGDWIVHNSYIRMLEGKIELCYYDQYKPA